MIEFAFYTFHQFHLLHNCSFMTQTSNHSYYDCFNKSLFSDFDDSNVDHCYHKIRIKVICSDYPFLSLNFKFKLLA